MKGIVFIIFACFLAAPLIAQQKEEALEKKTVEKFGLKIEEFFDKETKMLVKQKMYHENGILFCETPYENGLPVGKVKYYSSRNGNYYSYREYRIENDTVYALEVVFNQFSEDEKDLKLKMELRASTEDFNYFKLRRHGAYLNYGAYKDEIRIEYVDGVRHGNVSWIGKGESEGLTGRLVYKHNEIIEEAVVMDSEGNTYSRLSENGKFIGPITVRYKDGKTKEINAKDVKVGSIEWMGKKDAHKYFEYFNKALMD